MSNSTRKRSLRGSEFCQPPQVLLDKDDYVLARYLIEVLDKKSWARWATEIARKGFKELESAQYILISSIPAQNKIMTPSTRITRKEYTEWKRLAKRFGLPVRTVIRQITINAINDLKKKHPRKVGKLLSK